jgi:nucleoside-diphosphate-sugar epimerase
MDDGRPTILISNQMADWRGMRGYAENMAEAITLCVTLNQAARCIFHIADRENITEVDWIRRIGGAADWHGRIVALDDQHLPGHLKQGYNPYQDLALDSTRIRDQLGYTELVTPEEAMHQTVAWERANPPPKFNPSQFDYAAEEEALKAVSSD